MSWAADLVEAQYALDTVTKQQVTLPASHVFSPLPDNQVLRVFQLDALATQQEIVEILRASLLQLFNIAPLRPFRFKYQEELFALLDGLLYRYSTWRQGQSVGDRLQNLVMRDERCANEMEMQAITSFVPSLAPSPRLLLMHAVLTILVPYLARKFQRKTLEENWAREERHTWKYNAAKAFTYASIAWSVLSLLNTLHFFATGQYRNLVERLLSLKLVYGTQRMQRLTNLLYLNQHIAWQSWSSLLSVLNVGRYLNRLVRSVQAIASPAGALSGNENCCCSCREVPVISQRSNCGHLYCYYCIKSRLLDRDREGSFRCYMCGAAVHSCSPA